MGYDDLARKEAMEDETGNFLVSTVIWLGVTFDI